MATTLSELQAGNNRFALVFAIDGYPHVFSNEPETAVQAAWAGTDWAAKTVVPGLIVELDNQQSLDPWNPFRGGGKLVVKVQVQPNSTDVFAVDLARTDAGAETLLDETANRTSTLFVGLVDGFPLIGEAHVGTECFSYGFVAGRRFQPTLGDAIGSNRGKYVAFGVKDSASTYGAVRFAEHHRVATADNGARFRPIVSAQPRTWKGRRVSLWMHTKAGDGSLNSKADALCIFLGELSEPRSDDAHWTAVLCEHLLDKIPRTTLLRDQWSARVDYGMRLVPGQRFKFQDFDGTTVRTSDDLVVVSQGAVGSKLVNAGTYGTEEIASIFNNWLAGEKGAGRINGNYTIVSPEDVNGVPHTVVHYFIPGSSTAQGWFQITWPSSGWATAMGFIGSHWLKLVSCNGSHVEVSPFAVSPFDFVGQEIVGGTLSIRLENQVGIFQGQRATLPSSVKQLLDASTIPHDANTEYGLFLLECETPMVLLGTVIGNTLTRIRPLSFSLASDLKLFVQLRDAKTSVGKAPPTLRQIFIHEGPIKTVMKWLFYSTGTRGYNHSEFDVLPAGQGLGIPYDALGSSFELSCDAMPNANDTIKIVLERSRTFSDIIRADLVIRNSHLVFRTGRFRWVSWTSPSSAIVTTVLDQSNKAEVIGVKASQRTTAVLDSSWVKNVVTINFNRDIAGAVGGGEDVFLATPITFEDATSIDDHGSAKVTLDLRNVYNDDEREGQGVRALAAGMLSWFTQWARPLWKARRSIAPTLMDGFGVGEGVAMTDPDLRDPETGLRGITTRPGLVIGHRFSLHSAPAPEKLKFQGEVDVLFLHADRIFAYGPAAEVDETKNDGGFTAGHDGGNTWQFKPHEHSETAETVDLGAFVVDDHIDIIEIDPADPAAPDSFRTVINSIDIGNSRISVEDSFPGFNPAKRYRMVYSPFTTVSGQQTIKSFQAGATLTISEQSPPDVYGAYSLPPGSAIQATEYDHTRIPELLANISYGPNLGAVRDCGYDQEVSLLVDNLHDHRMTLSSSSWDTEVSTNAETTPCWKLLRIEMIWLSDLLYGNGVNRWLSIAPHWRSTGTSPVDAVQLRIWVSGYAPFGTSRINVDGQTPGYIIKAPAAGNSWSVMSSDVAWRTEGPRRYPLGNFNGHQYAFIIVEGRPSATIRGIPEVSDGERFVT